MPADPQTVQEVLKWIIRENLDFKQTLTPLVGRGFNTLEKVAAMGKDDIEGVLPQPLHKKATAAIARLKAALDDPGSSVNAKKRKSGGSGPELSKRKRVALMPPELPASSSRSPGGNTVRVNRSPVMVLWAAVVAHKLGHPWELALSLGSAIASLNSRAKGTALGIYKKADASDRSAGRAAAAPVASTMSLMGRTVEVRKGYIDVDGGVLAVDADSVAVRPESADKMLSNKFKKKLPFVYRAMRDLAAVLPKAELEKDNGRVAYDLYLRFRPDVPMGEAGWGALGDLRLDKLVELTQELYPIGRAPVKVAPKLEQPQAGTVALKKELVVESVILNNNLYAEISRRSDGITLTDLVQWCGQPTEVVERSVASLTYDMLIYTTGDTLRAL